MPDFIDDLKENVGKYLTAAGIKSGEFIDKTKIKLEIYSLNKEKENIFTELGEKVFRMFLKNKFDPDKLYEKCKDVVKLLEEIRAKEKEMKQVHDSADKVFKESLRQDKGYKRKHKHKKNIVETEIHDLIPLD